MATLIISFVVSCVYFFSSRPLQKLTTFKLVRSLGDIPLFGPLFAPLVLPPVSVHAVAVAAVNAALAKNAPRKTVIEVDDILELEA